jgi:Amt family ammonium transporter
MHTLKHLIFTLTVWAGLGLLPALTFAQETTPATATAASTETAAEPEKAADAKPAEPAPVATPAPVVVDTGDTAWMLVATAFVLMMTAPGLALFYGGLVRKKNILGVMMQCIILMGLMSVIWVVIGYSLAFDKGIAGGFVGGFSKVMLNGIAISGPTLNGFHSLTIPDLLWMIFQMMFFIITPGLICGAFAERMKFSAMVLFSALWGIFIYCPVAHWVWAADGWANHLNPDAPFKSLDFAGGTVVHLISGASALLCSIVIGKRVGFGREPMPPHNLTYTFIGATMLWVGWFGFNAGSAGAANAQAVSAFVATHIAAAVGTLAWAGIEWIKRGKPSILGACSGCVAGLVCITPAAGYVTPGSAMILGLAAGIVCYLACTTVKNTFGYDDSLDAFGVHGVGGTLGAILTGVFSSAAIAGEGKGGLLEGHPQQLINQLVVGGVALALALVGTFIILKVVDAVVGLRVSQDEEVQGLDVTQHGEEGYIFL